MDLKEKILDDSHRNFINEIGTSSINTKTFPSAYKEQALEAMDELSKIVAIAFFKWFYETYNEQYEGLPFSGNTTLGGMTVFIDKEEHPFEYAYELFTQSKEYHELMDAK